MAKYRTPCTECPGRRLLALGSLDSGFAGPRATSDGNHRADRECSALRNASSGCKKTVAGGRLCAACCRPPICSARADTQKTEYFTHLSSIPITFEFVWIWIFHQILRCSLVPSLLLLIKHPQLPFTPPSYSLSLSPPLSLHQLVVYTLQILHLPLAQPPNLYRIGKTDRFSIKLYKSIDSYLLRESIWFII